MEEKIGQIYKYLICEFDHWDICLSGLCFIDDEYYVCKVVDEHAEQVLYNLYKVELTDEAYEYLIDYKVAYKHWFHENGKRPSYDGWDLGWFREKWQGKNPVLELINA